MAEEMCAKVKEVVQQHLSGDELFSNKLLNNGLVASKKIVDECELPMTYHFFIIPMIKVNNDEN